MYGMGQSPLAMPTILQGAAYRETLSPEQLSRLESQGIPTAKASVNVSSVLPMLLIGGLAAWFLTGGTKRRTLWVYIGLLVSGESMWLLRANPLAAQTPFQDTVITAPDTFIVFGKQTVSVSVTVDSVIVRKPTPPVITLGKGYGPTNLIHDAPQPYAPFVSSSGESANRPDWLLDLLAKATMNGVRVIANLPCGSHNTSRLGNCLAIVNGVPRFSRTRFDSAMATYNTPAVKTAVLKAYRDSILTAINIMDEPWVTGGGDGNTWGPVPLPRALIDSLCLTAHNALGPVPIGTSDQTKWQRSSNYKWKWCDVGIAQFSFRFGQPTAWRDSILAISAAQGYQSLLQYNIVNGGTQDKDGTWNCAQQGGTKGQRSPNCTMTPDQIVLVSTALGASGCGPLGMWRYDAPRFGLAKFKPAFQSVADLQKQRAVAVCKVRP